MTVRFSRDRLLLYLCITVGFLVHWVHDDLNDHPGEFARILLNNVWQVIYMVGVNALYFEFVLPYVTSLKSYRVPAIIVSVVLHLLVLAIGLYGWWELGILVGAYEPFRVFTSVANGLSTSFRFTPGPFLVFAVFKLFYDYTRLRFEGQQVKLEKQQAELLYLRSQVNPHFLFNTLNNIYSLSQYQPELVSESVLRLSKILRYLLYETSNDLVTIEKEIKILTDYIDLEKLRYSESVSIDFTFDIDDFSEMIPPLLLLPLVENAFKHGVSVSRGTRFVEVKCVVKKNKLHFTVKNASSSTSEYRETEDNIGLSNLRRRLTLLYKSFEFVTERKESIFTVDLKIDLLSHV